MNLFIKIYAIMSEISTLFHIRTFIAYLLFQLITY